MLVEDMNDNAPNIPTSARHLQASSLTMSGHTVGYIRSTDGDTGINARHHYSLLRSSVAGLFSVDTKTGGVVAGQPLYSHDGETVTLTVQVQDGGG